MKSPYAFLFISTILINFSCNDEDNKPTSTNYFVHSNSHDEYVISTHDVASGQTVKKAYTYPSQYQLLSSIRDVAVYNNNLYVLGMGLEVTSSTDFSRIAQYSSTGAGSDIIPYRTLANGDYMYVFGRVDRFFGGEKFNTVEEASAANRAYQMTNEIFHEINGLVQQGDKIFISYLHYFPTQSHIIAFPKTINERLSELVIPGRTLALLANNKNEVIAVNDSSVYIRNASNFTTTKLTTQNLIVRLQDNIDQTRENSACLDPATNCLYFLQKPEQAGQGLFKCLTKWDLNTNAQTDIYTFPLERSNFNVTSLEFDDVSKRILLMGAEPSTNANAGVIMLNTDGTEAGFFETEGRPLWLSIVKH